MAHTTMDLQAIIAAGAEALASESNLMEGGRMGEGPPDQTIELTSIPQFRAILEKARTEMVVMASLNAITANFKGKSVDLELIIDKSGSMSGKKMDLVLKTILFIVKTLRSRDRLGLICFDSNLHPKTSLIYMTPQNKELLKDIVGKIRVGTMTNISAALFAGIQAFKKTKSDDTTKAIFLLTDGEANEGIRKIDQLVQIMKVQLEELSADVVVHTFGFGNRHKADFLLQMAEAANGSYFNIEDIDSVPTAFGTLLGGILTMVAHNIELEFSMCNGITLKGLVSPFKMETNGDGGIRVFIGDMYAEEERNALVRINIPPSIESEATLNDPTAVVSIKLNYINTLTGKSEQQELRVHVERLPMERRDELEEEVSDPNVTSNLVRLMGALALKDAKKMGDARNLDGGRSCLAKAKEEIKRTRESSRGFSTDQDLLMDTIIKSIETAEKGLVSTTAFHRTSNEIARTAAQYRSQRCTSSSMTDQACFRGSSATMVACSANNFVHSEAGGGGQAGMMKKGRAAGGGLTGYTAGGGLTGYTAGGGLTGYTGASPPLPPFAGMMGGGRGLTGYTGASTVPPTPKEPEKKKSEKDGAL